MDKNILEFWGQMFLNAARNQEKMEEWNKWFGRNTGGENIFPNSMFKQADTQKPKEFTPEIMEITKKATDAYKEMVKASLFMFDIISKEEYNEVLEENKKLKEKILELEEVINKKKKQTSKDSFEQEEVINNLTNIVKNQTEQFQDLMKQIGKYYKKDIIKK